MMACTRYPDDELVVRYVTSDLPESEQLVFEDHMFACDDCLARVELYQSAQQVLATTEAAPAGPPLPFPEKRPSPAGSGHAWWTYAAIAAALVVVAGGTFWVQRRQIPAPAGVTARSTTPPAAAEPQATPAARRSPTALKVAVLAMVTPPPYLPMTVRSEPSTDAAFDRGMDAYVQQDWPAAAEALTNVRGAAGRFYLGIAELMQGDAAAATAAFAQARSSGVQPYVRESTFYLAKAALRTGDVAKAREWLTAARAADAGPAKEAARLLAALDE